MKEEQESTNTQSTVTCSYSGLLDISQYASQEDDKE